MALTEMDRRLAAENSERWLHNPEITMHVGDTLVTVSGPDVIDYQVEALGPGTFRRFWARDDDSYVPVRKFVQPGEIDPGQDTARDRHLYLPAGSSLLLSRHRQGPAKYVVLTSYRSKEDDAHMSVDQVLVSAASRMRVRQPGDAVLIHKRLHLRGSKNHRVFKPSVERSREVASPMEEAGGYLHFAFDYAHPLNVDAFPQYKRRVLTA